MERGGKIEGYKLDITKALATLEARSNKYLANLPVWYQYIVWTYTLGSQAVNRRLVGIPLKPKGENEWTLRLFEFFDYGIENIGKNFKRFTKFFENPKLHSSLPIDKQNEISQVCLDSYTIDLQRTILGCPPTIGDIIVYKASTPYDVKLTENKFPYTLEQTPFNSTTYDPWFDFNAFLGSNQDTCCLWEILIPKGSRVLAIAHPFQAYLTEREVLLPFDSEFVVHGARQVPMSYYLDREAPIRTQGEKPRIGEVFRHDNWDNRPKSIKNMRMLEATFVQ